MPQRCLPLLIAVLTLCVTSASCAQPAEGDDDELTATLDYKVAFPSNQVRLPQLLGDGAVLQRDMKIPIWGWGQYTRTVTITIAGESTSTSVGLQNLWATTIGPLPAGGPYELVVGDGLTTVTSPNVLVGDVWLCSGQSNMTQTLAGSINADEEIAAANVPGLRLFQVPRTTAFAPQNDFPPPAAWTECTSDTAQRFSAIGYYFGRNIHANQDVPVGIIEASWPNTTIPVWMSEAACSLFGDYDWWQNLLRRTSTPQGRARLDDDQRSREWIVQLQENAEGSSGTRAWFDPRLRLDRKWKSMRLPSPWEAADLPNFDGIVWFRKNVELPASWRSTTPTLQLAHIYDYATVWWNGERIGQSDDWKTTATFIVPQRLLHKGANTIAVRVLDTVQYGGIHGTSSSLVLETTTTEGFTSIPLTGDWKYRVGLNLAGMQRPWESTEHWPHPSAMYNGMIAPLVSHAIRGVVWLQGEADAHQGMRYRELFSAFIRDWRARWKQPDMPFVFAQIASFLPYSKEPGESGWSEVRESQTKVWHQTKHTAMTPMYDLGGTTEPHYMRKHEAAERLTSAALNVVYGQANVVYKAPELIPDSIRIRGNRLRLSFETTTGGLIVRGSKISGFQVAGQDRKFSWADAELVSSNTIELRSPVKKPTAVRYGWDDHPRATLFSAEGVPALPFRTDKWPTTGTGP